MASSTTVTATATTSARSQQQQQQQQQQAVEQAEDHALVVVAATNRCAERINIALPDSTGGRSYHHALLFSILCDRLDDLDEAVIRRFDAKVRKELYVCV